MRTIAWLMVALLLGAAVPAQADWPSFHNDSRKTGNVPFSTYPVFEEVWWNNKTLANAQIKASPVIKDNILITADLAGLVRALDVASGKQLWSHKMASRVEGTPAISGERVYVADSAGALKALNLRNGDCEHGCQPLTPAVNVGATLGAITVTENKLFIGTEAGEVKAYLASTLTLLWTFSLNTVYQTFTSTTTGSGTSSQTSVSCTNPMSGQPIRAAPAVYDGRVFFGTMNHWVFAVDEQGQGDGKTMVQWMYKTEDVVLASPAINTKAGEAARVIFASYDGKIYGFKAAPGGTGQTCPGNLVVPHKQATDWTYSVPNIIDTATGDTLISKVHSSPAAVGHRIYVGANNGNVYALNSSTGQKVWERVAGSALSPVTSSAAVANNIVVIGSEDKKVYWLNAGNGSVLKTFTTQSAVGTSPAIDGDRAIVASQDGTLYMFGPAIPKRADLQITALTATSTGIDVTVRNAGDAAANATTMRLFVADTFLANVDVPALGPGESKQISHPTEMEKGLVVLKAIVDPDNKVTESNDSNNERETPVEIVSGGGGDGGDGGGGGFKIPGPGLVPLLALLALAALAMRRRRA